MKYGMIPPLPGDTIGSLFGKGRFKPEFVEERRKKLDQWLKAICSHKILRLEKIFIDFLQNDIWPPLK